MSIRYYALTFAMIFAAALALGLLMYGDQFDWQRLLACLIISIAAVTAVELFKFERAKRNG